MLFRTKRELGDKREFEQMIINYGGCRYLIRNSRGKSLRAFMLGEPERDSMILFYCMGRDGDIERRTKGLSLLLEAGLPVFIFESSGYGESEGRPTLPGYLQDASEACHYLIDSLGYHPGQLVIYGESLGSVAAAQLLSRLRPAGVVIKSGFTSLERMVKDRMPFLRSYPSWMFCNMGSDLRGALRAAAVPVLIVHGLADRMVKHTQAQEIFQSINEPKELVILPESRHGFMSAADEITFAEAVARFVFELSGVSTSASA